MSWNDLIEDQGRNVPHGSISPESPFVFLSDGGVLLITLEYPHVDKWVNLSSENQKKVLTKLFNDVIHVTDPYNIDSFKCIFEFHKTTGHVHLHGYVKFNSTFRFVPIGAVCDVAKRYHNAMPKAKYKRYHMYDSKCLHPEYCRYKNPGICIQYISKDDETGFNRWIDYMAKQQSPINGTPASPDLK